MEYCLAHHGVKGQRWGVRRYQNEDGTLTPEGRRRYGLDGGHFLRRNENKKETARRSAVLSMKSTAKAQSKVGLIGAGAAAAVITGMGGPAGAAAIAAGSSYVASLSGMTIGAGIIGYTRGAKLGARQNESARRAMIDGSSFVARELSSINTGINIGPYYRVKESIDAEPIGTGPFSKKKKG